MPRPTFTLFTMNSGFALACLKALLSRQLYPQAIVLPGVSVKDHNQKQGDAILSSLLPAQTTNAISDIAKKRELPVIYTQLKHPGEVDWLRQQLHSDIVLVCCFPYRIPVNALNPSILALNLHPSALPKYRGPAPLFWQLYSNERQLGVSLHRVTAAMDQGPIVAQRLVTRPPAQSQQQLYELLAHAGVDLFFNAVLQTLRLGQPIAEQLQDETAASYYPNPQAANFHLDLNWDLKHGFDFLRGTFEPGQTYRVQWDEESQCVGEAIGCLPGDSITAPVQVENGQVKIQLRGGVLIANRPQLPQVNAVHADYSANNSVE